MSRSPYSCNNRGHKESKRIFRCFCAAFGINYLAKPHFLIPLIIPLLATAQIPDHSMEFKLESIAEGNEENQTDLLHIAEDMEELTKNKIYVNFAGEEELSRIPFLNVFQINNLLQYRYRSGSLYSPYELSVIKGFDRETIDRILPYLNFSAEQKLPVIKGRNIIKYSRHQLILRSSFELQKRKGYLPETQNGYLGDPSSYYLRYKGIYSDLLSVAVTAQQDAGEPVGTKYHRYGVDFISGHVAVKNYGQLRSLIFGNYQAEFGQGLAFWSSSAFGKSANAVDIKRYARGFIPFSGGEENRALQGAAASYELWDKLKISAFWSRRRIDANVSALDSNAAPAYVSSLPATGLHRTNKELAGKDANVLRITGGNINYRGHGFSIGATAINYYLTTPLEKADALYKKFRFSGDRLSNFSIDANYLYRDLNLFGEFALSGNSARAGIIGLQSNPADPLYFTLLYRHFQKEYQALYHAPFAESGNYGEQGTFVGLQWNINRTFRLNAYIDSYNFKWMRYRVDAPSYGRDILAQLKMRFSRYFTSYIRIKNSLKQSNDDKDVNMPGLQKERRTSLRFHTTYHIYPQIRMASRVEHTFYDASSQNETGLLIFQDVRYDLKKLPMQFSTRFAITDTESYSTRIYAYENDLLYSFSIPAYYGRSTRFYLLLAWDINSRMAFQAKYGITTFFDRNEIGSGMDLIKGNKRSSVNVQLRLKI